MRHFKDSWILAAMFVVSAWAFVLGAAEARAEESEAAGLIRAAKAAQEGHQQAILDKKALIKDRKALLERNDEVLRTAVEAHRLVELLLQDELLAVEAVNQGWGLKHAVFKMVTDPVDFASSVLFDEDASALHRQRGELQSEIRQARELREEQIRVIALAEGEINAHEIRIRSLDETIAVAEALGAQ